MLAVFSQSFETYDLAIIALLVILEGTLSIDNALVLGLLAKRLPKHQQKKALTYGLVGAFVFRIIAIAVATFLLKWTIFKLLGGAYLLYIALKHFFFDSKSHDQHERVRLDSRGHPILEDETTGELTPERREEEIAERSPLVHGSTGPVKQFAKFWPTVFVIEMTDIAFAIDSIVAAIGVVGRPPADHPADAFHPKLWVVILGGFMGVALMRFAAVIFIKMLDRFPRFEMAAYLLVTIIGLKLVVDWGAHYMGWHTVNFHSPSSIAFWAFWVLMIVCFAVGFMGKRVEKIEQSVTRA